MRNLMSILKLFPNYRLSWIVPDLIAGVTVWGIIIPLAMAYAGLVGVDPIVGIYTLPLALLGYMVFGGSRFHVTGADAGVSVLTGATVASVVAESFVTFLTNEGISDIQNLMFRIRVFIDSPELIYGLPAAEWETLEARNES